MFHELQGIVFHHVRHHASNLRKELSDFAIFANSCERSVLPHAAQGTSKQFNAKPGFSTLHPVEQLSILLSALACVR